MKILITGGAGFIGSNLVDCLIEKNEILVIDDLSGGYSENINKKALFINVDCRNEKAVDKVIKKFRPEIVYHLAANAAENKAQFSPIDITSRNYDAFIKVITPSIKYGMKKFIFTSSIAVYGAQQTPFKETTKPEPKDLYGTTKLAIEQSIRILSKVHNFNYVIVRPHNVYGPRQNMADPYRNVVTIWMNSILNNQPTYIYGDGTQIRCFSYIEDVTDSLIKCLTTKADGLTFNIGSDKCYTLNDLNRIIYQIADVFDNTIHLEDRPQEVKVAISDHTLAKKYLGYKNTDLITGLKKTWKWCRQKGPQKPKFTRIEIPSEQLPKNW